MRPLGNIMYQNLLTWRGSTKEVVLQVKDDSPGAKKKTQVRFHSIFESTEFRFNRRICDQDVKLKCDTETVKSIVKQMEDQAAKLAAEHRARRKFKIAQEHLPDQPGSLLLQVQDRAVALMTRDPEEVVQEIPFSDIVKWEQSSTPPIGKTTELVITLSGDKDPIKVKSAKTTSIIEALESKVGPRVEEGVPPSPDAEPAADAPQTDTEGLEGAALTADAAAAASAAFAATGGEADSSDEDIAKEVEPVSTRPLASDVTCLTYPS